MSIRVRGLTKRFRGEGGVSELELDVDGGEVVAVVGPNGAGKSTALRLIGGQMLPDAGTITMGGIDLARDPLGAKRRMGYLPQEPVLYPYLTGEEYLGFIAKIRGVGDLGPYLEACDLGPAAKRLTREYSYGMQKRLAFAGVLMGGLDALLLDEVFAGLDPVASRRVAALLRRERERGAAILFSGHEMASVAELADRVVVLASGRVVHRLEAGDLAQLKDEAGALERVFREIVEG